jgi:hypothetical protein
MFEGLNTFPLPQNGTAWEAPRGRLGVWVPCSNMLVLAIDRHGHAEFASHILAAYRTLDATLPLYVFAELGQMTSYDTGIRTELTAGFLPDRERFAAFHVLLRSKIVAMGVTVANLALGGFVDISDNAVRFKNALDAALFENKVAGFSSDALETPRFRTG